MKDESKIKIIHPAGCDKCVRNHEAGDKWIKHVVICPSCQTWIDDPKTDAGYPPCRVGRRLYLAAVKEFKH